MPVRIIFRGLILFHFPDEGDDKGKLVALLINNSAFTGGGAAASAGHSGHGPHEHNHGAEIQILEGAGEGNELVPKRLKEKSTVDIVIRGGPTGVARAPSFNQYVPSLGQIIAKGTPAVQNAVWGQPNGELIQNYVIVNRGVARVREVATWDESGYPLSGRPEDRGARPSSAAIAKFMGSSVAGNMASEIVVDVDDATSADVFFHHEPASNKHAKGSNRPNHRVSKDTVEILIANYEFQRGSPVPYGLDFQWMFEAVGYQPVDLGGTEFREWERFADRYNHDLFVADRNQLLNGTVGRPFPYIVSQDSLVRLQPLTDERERPLCITALIETSERILLTDGTIIERTFRIMIPRTQKLEPLQSN